MIYIAKMGTRYPDFHGNDYYNFLMDDTREGLKEQLERHSHDFYLIYEVTTRHHNIEAVTKAYPTKYKLNEKYFKGIE